MEMDDFELELKKDFLEESIDLLNQAESAFMRLENEPDNKDILNEIFRLAHNLKGTSKAVGFEKLSVFTHVAENLILELKEDRIKINPEIIRVLLQFKDHVTNIVQLLNMDMDADFDIDEVKQILEDAINGKFANSASSPQDTAVANDNTAAEAIENSASQMDSEAVPIEVLAAVNDVPAATEFAGTAEPLETTLTPSPDSQTTPTSTEVNQTPGTAKPTAEKKKSEGKANTEDESIRVKLSRINKLNNIMGELVILQTVLNQRRFGNIQDDLSNKSITQMSKLLKEMQELSMSLRLVPLKTTFQKMARIVRDTSLELDKQINLVLEGENTEVDKTVFEQITDPLVHIVRNAVDHGIEEKEARVASGKDAKGNIKIRAFHEGSNLVIEVTDDGKGLDPEKLREKAIAKGVISATASLTEEQSLNLIFHPGFSTKEQVTDLSGRGVGMDVVKSNIEKLGGEVNLSSKVGQGSVIRLVLPLTLSIIDGLVVRVVQQQFVIPLSQVYEFSRVNKKDISVATGVGKLFMLRGEVLPLFTINQKLGYKSESDSEIVIIVRGLDHAFGVVVDDVVNQQQVVIKKLGDELKGQKGYVGSAILGDGKPSLILDLFEMFKHDMKESSGFRNIRNEMRRSA